MLKLREAYMKKEKKVKEFKRKFGLKNKITSLIFGLILLILLVFLGAVASITGGIIDKKSRNELKNYSEQIYSLVDISVDTTVNNTLELIMSDTSKKISDFNADFSNGKISKEEALLKITEVIKTVKVGSFGFAYILDNKGVFLYHPTEQGKNQSSKDYIKKILEEKNGLLSINLKQRIFLETLKKQQCLKSIKS